MYAADPAGYRARVGDLFARTLPAG
jgi:hypothetical protein